VLAEIAVLTPGEASMKSTAAILLLVLGVSVLAAPAVGGGLSDGDTPPHTDANIITAIDDSSSVTRLERMVAYTGLSKAVRDSHFLSQVAGGPDGRVGFVAFTWSGDGRTEVIVPWMLIATADDAEIASAMLLRAAHIDSSKQFAVRTTDIALAIGTAAKMQRASPYVANHTFINICSDGISNSGASPRAVRDSVLEKNVTISAVLFGNRPMLADYYARNVVGGAGAFILPISDAVTMSKLMVRKYWLDLTS
jgi:hypothetical protein